MRTSKIRLTLSCLMVTFVCLACAFLGLGKSTSVKAATIDDVNFVMETGASIRTEADSTGIRFAAYMTADDYEVLNGLGYDKVEYGMIIVPYDYVAENDVIKDGKINEDAYFYQGYVGETANKKEIINLNGNLTEYERKNDQNSYMAFKGVMLSVQEHNYLRDFVGVGYIRMTIGENVTYKFATTDYNQNKRNVVYTAQLALDAGEADTNNVLSGYIGKVSEEDVNYTVEHYFDAQPVVENLVAKVNSTVNAVAKVKAPYVVDTEKSVMSSKAYANGSTVLKVYYKELSVENLSFVGSASIALPAEFDVFGDYQVSIYNGDNLVDSADYTLENDVLTIDNGIYNVVYTFADGSVDRQVSVNILKDYTTANQYLYSSWYGRANLETIASSTIVDTIGLPKTIGLNNEKTLLKATNTGASNFGVSILMPEVFNNLDTLPENAVVKVYLYATKCTHAEGIIRDQVFFCEGQIGTKYTSDYVTVNQDAWTTVNFPIARIKELKAATGYNFDRVDIAINRYATGNVVYLYGVEIDLQGRVEYGATTLIENLSDVSNSAYYWGANGTYSMVEASTVKNTIGLPNTTAFDADKPVLKVTPVAGATQFGVQIRTNAFNNGNLNRYNDNDYFSIYVYSNVGMVDRIWFSDGRVSDTGDGGQNVVSGSASAKINNFVTFNGLTLQGQWTELTVSVGEIKAAMAARPIVHIDRLTLNFKSITDASEVYIYGIEIRKADAIRGYIPATGHKFNRAVDSNVVTVASMEGLKTRGGADISQKPAGAKANYDRVLSVIPTSYNNGAWNSAIAFDISDILANIDNYQGNYSLTLWVASYFYSSNGAYLTTYDPLQGRVVGIDNTEVATGGMAINLAAGWTNGWTAINIPMSEIKAAAQNKSGANYIIYTLNGNLNDPIYVYSLEVTDGYGSINDMDTIGGDNGVTHHYYWTDAGNVSLVEASTLTDTIGIPSGTSYSADKKVLKVTPKMNAYNEGQIGVQIKTPTLAENINAYNDNDYISLWVYVPTPAIYNGAINQQLIWIANGYISGSGVVSANIATNVTLDSWSQLTVTIGELKALAEANSISAISDLYFTIRFFSADQEVFVYGLEICKGV